MELYPYIYCKLANHSRGRPKGFLFNSYYTKVEWRHYFFTGIAPLTLDPYLYMLSVKQEVSSTIFLVFVMIRSGMNLRSTGQTL